MKLYSKEERYWIWLNKMLGSGYARFHNIAQEYGGPEGVFDAAKCGKLTIKSPLNEGNVRFIQKNASEGFIDDYLEGLNNSGIGVTTPISEDYPYLLSETYDPPTVLFYRGTVKRELTLPIAVIGARKCTEYGRRVAFTLSRQLSDQGVCVISGLAYGIDGESSRGALASIKSDYPTVAVLGTGVDVVYPNQNRPIYDAIVERGAVVSEFAPGTQAIPGNFPRRNRVISGLSKGILVVEAREKSGTLITVNHALDQGRDIFSVPGRITDASCRGTNNLIRRAMAKPVFGINDILEEYGISLSDKPDARPSRDIRQTLDGERAVIYDLLKDGDKTFDELCESMSIEAGALNTILTELEFSRIIIQTPGRVFSIR